MRRTLEEFATELDVPKEIAEGLIKFMLAKKWAIFRGERPPEHGRGKGAYVYTIPYNAGNMMRKLIEKLEEHRS